jgi:hypothetical protein
MSAVGDLLKNTPGGLVSDIAGKLIDTVAGFFPNPEKRAEAAQAIAIAQLNGAFKEEEQQFQLMLEQIKVNEEEAKSTNWFVAGGRPFVVWVGGFTLFYAGLGEPLLRFIASVGFGYAGAFPVVDTTVTLQVLTGILGLGGMRSFEKFKGVAR